MKVGDHRRFMERIGRRSPDIRTYGWRESARGIVIEVEFDDGTMDIEQTATFDEAMEWLAFQMAG